MESVVKLPVPKSELQKAIQAILSLFPFGFRSIDYTIPGSSKMVNEVPQQEAEAPELVIGRLNFQRLVRDIMRSQNHPDFQFQASALEALQTGTEGFMKEVMREATITSEAAGRPILTPADLAEGVQRVTQG